jgi:hypothetical protein
MLKVNGSTLIIEETWKKLLIHSNINVGIKTVTCVLINYSKCKMQLMSTGFNMLKVDSFLNVQKNHKPIIMHCVNKIKGYLNFHINNLKLLNN